MDPSNTSHEGGEPAFSRTCFVAFTENGSTSMLTTRDAPERCAASEWIPLPQPMSRKLFPERSGRPRKNPSGSDGISPPSRHRNALGHTGPSSGRTRNLSTSRPPFLPSGFPSYAPEFGPCRSAPRTRRRSQSGATVPITAAATATPAGNFIEKAPDRRRTPRAAHHDARGQGYRPGNEDPPPWDRKVQAGLCRPRHSRGDNGKTNARRNGGPQRSEATDEKRVARHVDRCTRDPPGRRGNQVFPQEKSGVGEGGHAIEKKPPLPAAGPGKPHHGTGDPRGGRSCLLPTTPRPPRPPSATRQAVPIGGRYSPAHPAATIRTPGSSPETRQALPRN